MNYGNKEKKKEPENQSYIL